MALFDFSFPASPAHATICNLTAGTRAETKEWTITKKKQVELNK
jgi:hypothetical protein